MPDLVANSMRIVEYAEHDAADWDEFVSRAPMASFLHTRRFLSYHGRRFRDLSLLLKNDAYGILGLLPAAADPLDARRVISHPGITFGGMLHAGNLNGEKMIDALGAVRDYYLSQGMRSLLYKAIPAIYHQVPSGDDLYALFRLDARRSRCELSSAIDLTNRRQPGSRRKRGLRKALKAGVEVKDGDQFIDELWQVLEDNLERKLGQKPVHTKDEIRNLASLFPENIKFIVGLLNGHVIAGTVLFCSRSVTRAQYIAADETAYDASALDAVFEHAIVQAHAEGRRYFDFGTSNSDEGRQLSTPVYQFKTEFGGGGVAQEVYELDLGAGGAFPI
jgi:hypothetical protein